MHSRFCPLVARTWLHGIRGQGPRVKDKTLVSDMADNCGKQILRSMLRMFFYFLYSASLKKLTTFTFQS